MMSWFRFLRQKKRMITMSSSSASSSSFVRDVVTAQSRIDEVVKNLTQTTDFRKYDPISRQYLQLPGITCVMALKDKELGKEIHKILCADPIYNEYILLLPSESYHCTLSGLEGLMLDDDEAHKLCEPLSNIAHTIATYQDEVDRKFSSSSTTSSSSSSGDGGRGIGTIQMEPRQLNLYQNVSACTLVTVDDSTEERLRIVENDLYTTLTGGRMKGPCDSQIWHMTIGYFVRQPENYDIRCDIDDRMFRAVKSAMDKVTTTYLEFEKPKVCTYQSMERFDPIFE